MNGSSVSLETSSRAHFVDLLRLWMSVQMVQGHTIAALLDPALRAAPWFETWTWIRGFTAPGFLTAAGLSFYLSTLSSRIGFEKYRAARHLRARRARRALSLILIGYALHAPLGLLTGNVEHARASLEEAQIVDVLQCIGVTLLVLEALVSMCARVSQVLIASLVLGAAVIGLAPMASAIDCESAGAWRFACNFISRSGGSLFPLLPWSGYTLLGVGLGAVAMPRGASTHGAQTALTLAVSSVLLVLSATWLESMLGAHGLDSSRMSDLGAWPPLVLSRLGGVLGMAAFFGIVSARWRSLPRALRLLARETLFLYVSHLLVLYVVGVGLARSIGPTLSVGEAVFAAIVMVTACGMGAYGWSELLSKRNQPSIASH